MFFPSSSCTANSKCDGPLGLWHLYFFDLFTPTNFGKLAFVPTNVLACLLRLMKSQYKILQQEILRPLPLPLLCVSAWSLACPRTGSNCVNSWTSHLNHSFCEIRRNCLYLHGCCFIAISALWTWARSTSIRCISAQIADAISENQNSITYFKPLLYLWVFFGQISRRLGLIEDNWADPQRSPSQLPDPRHIMSF